MTRETAVAISALVYALNRLGDVVEADTDIRHRRAAAAICRWGAGQVERRLLPQRLLVRRDRRWIWAGLAWFFVTLLAMLAVRSLQ